MERESARYQTPGAGRPQSSAQRGVERLDSFTIAFEELGGVRPSAAPELGAQIGVADHRRHRPRVGIARVNRS
jgi:hypothetical protein